jgi:hypothetical protein
MATTTNYGWDTPDDTDLVKDGAAAIRTLGSSIDTTTKNLNPQTTTGALAYRSATANVNTALPIGTANQVLRVNSGGTAPEWATTADQTPLTTKGDLFGFDTADARIPVGTNGHILTADSTQSLGLKWAAPAASGGMTVIASGSIANSATGFSITSIPATYYNLQLVIRNSNSGATAINSRLRVNNLSTSIYSRMANYGSITTAGAATGQAETNILLDFENSARDADQSIYVINFWDYAGNSFKSGTVTGCHQIQNGANFEIYTGSFGVRTTSALDRIDLISGSANTFSAAGTYTLYGVK